jgi:tetratricopeptide (TPR) repeat protein
LARDIQRYLADEPVEASPPSARYRLGKFARKHRAALVTAAAFALVLIAATAISAWEAVRATQEESKAKQSASESKAVLGFFQNRVVAAARPEDQEGGLGYDVSLRAALDAAKKSIAAGFADQPVVEATIRDTLGESYRMLGEPTRAMDQHERAWALRKVSLGLDHPDTLTSMNNLALAHRDAGRTADALPLHEEVLKLRKAKLGPDHPDTLLSMNNLAAAYVQAGRRADAIPLFEQVLKLRKAKLGPDHPHTLLNMNNLAATYRDAGRTADAIPLYEETLEILKTKLGPDHPHTLLSMNGLAVAYLAVKRWAEAETLLRDCLELREKKLPDEWQRFHTMSQLGAALAGQKKYAEAEPLLIQGYEGLKAREATISAPAKKYLSAAAARIVPFYEAWGQPAKAAAWRAKLPPTAEGDAPKP